MGTAKKVSLALSIVSFVALIAATTFKASPSANPTVQGTEIQLPVIVYQMEAENGEMPVTLQCGVATVTAPDTLNGFSCTLINNTDKNIVAATAAYTIEYEQRGRPTEKSGRTLPRPSSILTFPRTLNPCLVEED